MRRAIGLALALALTGANHAYAATTQCDRCFVAVDANANVQRSRGVASAKRVTLGQYEVIFSKLVTKCVSNATVGSITTFSGAKPVMIMTAGAESPNQSKGVSVRAFDKTGFPTDTEFQLTLTCLPN
jgi:hypothetical protein